MPVTFDLDEHYRAIGRMIAKKPTHVFISTFGLYAGILDTGQDITLAGDKFKTKCKDILDILAKLNVKTDIIVGVADYKSCNKEVPCKSCEDNYARGLIRLSNHAEYWPGFSWKFSMACHLKCMIFMNKDTNEIYGISGGRNFTNSGWVDSTIELNADDCKAYLTLFNSLWKQSEDISLESLQDIIK